MLTPAISQKVLSSEAHICNQSLVFRIYGFHSVIKVFSSLAPVSTVLCIHWSLIDIVSWSPLVLCPFLGCLSFSKFSCLSMPSFLTSFLVFHRCFSVCISLMVLVSFGLLALFYPLTIYCTLTLEDEGQWGLYEHRKARIESKRGSWSTF